MTNATRTAKKNKLNADCQPICTSPYCGRKAVVGELLCEKCLASWTEPKTALKKTVNEVQFRACVHEVGSGKKLFVGVVWAEDLVAARVVAENMLPVAERGRGLYTTTYRYKITLPRVTATSMELFLAYAKDAGNWGGTPLVGGNVGGNAKAQRGNLTQLKKAGLIETFTDDRNDFLSFTDYGMEVAAAKDVYLQR